MSLDNLSADNNPRDQWKPNLEGAVSLEHRECIELAYNLCAIAEKKFPTFFEGLDTIPSTEELIAESKGEAEVMSIERERSTQDIGEINGFEYLMKISRADKLMESRISKNPDPEMRELVSVGIVSIGLKPKSSKEKGVNPLTSVTVSVGRYGDEDKLTEPRVIAEIPSANKTQTIEGNNFSMWVTERDDTHVPKHLLSLNQVASSENPEFGRYALLGIKEILEHAIAELEGSAT